MEKVDHMGEKSRAKCSFMSSIVDRLNGIKATYKRMKVSLSELEKDQTYQRVTSSNWVKTLIRTWKDALCEDICVVSRSGKLFVIDGWHRVEAMKALGKQWCWARVYFDVDKDSEPLLFVARNGFKQPITQLELYHAAKAANEPVAVAIHDILQKYGLNVPKSGSDLPTNVCCIRGVRRIALNENGEKILDTVCKVITTAWDDTTPHRTNRPILEGIGLLFRKFGERIETDRLVEILSKKLPAGIMAAGEQIKASTGGEWGRGCANAIIRAYNARLLGNRRLPPLE